MASLALATAFAALLTGAGAQSAPAGSNDTVWAAVAFIMHGERTPIKSTLSSVLTPVGAAQLWTQGAAFRARYLSGTEALNGTDFLVTSRHPIAGIERNAIDNTQLDIFTSTDGYDIQGATAFMQGLYPPIAQAYPANVGGVNISESTITGQLTNYPLGGYQYPVINALSVLEETSIPLQGTVGCPEWLSSTQIDLRQDPDMIRLYNQTLNFYQTLFTQPPLAGMLSLWDANFWDAHNIYEYVNYLYNHNDTVFRGLDKPSATLALLKSLAEDQQIAMNSHQAASGNKGGDRIRTVAGQTLAQKVLEQFSNNNAWGGAESKLTLMFGSLEPFLAFWSLAGLQSKDSPDVFSKLPEPGSAMVFELIGNDKVQPGVYPDYDSLQVRFVYRANTNTSTPFLEQSLFGMQGTVMRYLDFVAAMQKISMDVNQWCQTCESIQYFCLARNANSSPTVASTFGASPLGNPAVAGVIGAVITVALVGLGLLLAFFLGGFRVHRTGGQQRNSTLGGFKGAEKMASDRDVADGRGGAHHERVGSWELRDGKNVASDTVTTTRDFDRRHVDDDAISEMGILPTKPRESF